MFYVLSVLEFWPLLIATVLKKLLALIVTIRYQYEVVSRKVCMVTNKTPATPLSVFGEWRFFI
jgi:hypothetical protein